MIYFINYSGGFIDSVGTASAKTVENQITESEYNAILKMIQSAPKAPDGWQYKLSAATLEWMLVELPPVEEDPLTDESALTRYSNELTGNEDETLTEAAETLIKKVMEEK